MAHNKIKPAKGTLLISEPALSDNYFERSIVVLAEHNEEGSYGLIVNKPTDVKLNDVTREVTEFNSQLYLGGPVSTDNLYILHKIGPQIGNSIEIIKGLYWGGNLDEIRSFINQNPKHANHVRFYVGYSSWVPNQLDQEIEHHSWLIDRASVPLVFSRQPKKTWGEVIKGFGEDYAIWANFPSNPILN